MTAGKLLPPTTIYPCFKEGPLLILKYNVDKKNQGCPPTTQNSLYWTKKIQVCGALSPQNTVMKIHPVLPLVLSLVTIGLPGLRCFVWVCFGTFEQHVKVPDSIFMVILSMLKILSLLTELFKIIEACHRFTLSHLSLSTWVDLRYISNKEISKLLF